MFLAAKPAALLLVVLISSLVVAAKVGAADVAVDILLNDLHRPRGVVVRPGGTADRFEIFVADSGAGRIVRWSNQAPKQASEVVTGFEANGATALSEQTGPLALWFLDPGLLVVGTTQAKSGDLLRAYELQDGEKVLAADTVSEATSKTSGLAGASCTAITRSRVNEFVADRLFLAVRRADGRAQLMAGRVQAGMIGEPQPFGTQTASSPGALAISNSGRVVVADTEGRLIFYSPIDGQVELAMSTKLKQPIGLAYNPASGILYAADFAGGIYRVEDASEPGNPACRNVKVADVNRPTGLAFGPDGSLYVVTFGSSSDNGTLAVLSGKL
jgi:sugar lactone lactonase YvrE